MMVDISSAYAGKRVLITGGLGFIGSNLARRLVTLGAEVCLVDAMLPGAGGNWFNIDDIRSQVRVEVGSISDKALMRPLVQPQDYLFNLAGQVSHLEGMQNPENDLQLNCAGHVALLDICRQENPALRLVYSSTRQVYGRPGALPVNEKQPPAPVDFNGINKMAAEWYHLLYQRIYGLHTSVLRLTNVYGPRMWVRDGRLTFIGLWFRQLVEGQELRVFGSGKQIRDFNFVEDVVDALLLTAASPAAAGQTYNLGGDEPLRLLDLARRMVALNGAGSFCLVPFPRERKRIDIGDYFGDYAKIRAELGWQPQTPLSEGLTRTLDYYRQFHAHYW